MYATDKLKKRREAARKERDSFQPLLDEVYQYAMPYRKSSRDTGTGDKRVNQAFDHTLIESCFRFAGKLQQDLWPAGQQNFELAPGPMVLDPNEKDQLARGLAPIASVAQAFFEDGDFDLALHEMGIDLSAGTGAMLMNSTADPDRLWDPMSVSIEEVMLEVGANGKVTGVFWDRKMTVRALYEAYPDGKFGEVLTDLKAKKPEDEIDVRYDTIFEPPANGRRGRWRLCVWCTKQDALVAEEESVTAPWLTPRYFRVPGEAYGRGLAMLAMPTAKTLNTSQRLQLQAAAIAMLGIYTAVDDGVFNPDLSPVSPGVFWKVAKNGGTLGKSVERFPDPRLDLAQLVLQDLRAGVKSTMMDDDLPLNGEAVKSPTEILERVKRLASDHVGAFGRLVKEIAVPAVKRVLELAYRRGAIQTNLTIDQLLVKVQVKSPMAIAREAKRVQNIVNWLQLVIGIIGALEAAPSVGRVARVELMLRNIATSMGIEPQFVVPPEDQEKIDKMVAEKIAAAQLANMAAGGAQ